MIKSIPLNKLCASPRNVRRSSDEQADLQLKADIEARGLLQNLVVTSVAKSRGCFAVEGGGRRLRALHALAAEGKLSKTHEVACLVLDCAPEAAKEASLAENFQRLAMNPADECLAFQRLVEEGLDAEGIARRFGLSTRFVEGRLRLAGLAPAIFEALGSGEITLDVAKAYAVTPDRERQAFVFEQMGQGYGGTHPDSIRRMMTQATVTGSDRRALFVGEEAYVAAGGRIERDLFSGDEDARWLDIMLLDDLARDKLQALADEAAEANGFKWVRATLERWVGYPKTEGLRRVPTATAPLTDAETAALDQLEAELEEHSLSLEDEGMGEEARDAAEANVRDLYERIDAIRDKPPIVDDALKGAVGAFMMLDANGRPKLDHGRFVETDEEAEAEADPVDDECVSPNPAGPRGLARRLVDELAIQRRDVLAAELASSPALSLDLAIFLMADRGHGYEKAGSSLSAAPASSPLPGFKTPDAAAALAGAEADSALDRSWCEGASKAERFDLFRALPDAARSAWLCQSVARTIEASLNHPGPRACAFHEHLGTMIGIDVARWWRPTAANYFDRIPKSAALLALEEVGGPSLAAQYSGSKKAELAMACERIFAGNVIAEAEVKERALAWVPQAMRFEQPTRPDPEDVGQAAAGEHEAGRAQEGGGACAPTACEFEQAA